MSPPRSSVPSYRRHKPSGQAIVTVRLPNGKRRDIYLGPWKSEESKAEYSRIIAELQASPKLHLQTGKTALDACIDECLIPYLKHCDLYYRHPNGKPTGQAETVRASIKPLSDLYGHTLAKDFGPLGLKSIQRQMIAQGLSRKVINQRISLIRQFFRWCVAEQLVPSTIFEGLRAIPGLRAGRSEARELPPIQPADQAIVEAALPFMRPAISAMVQLQMHSGARGGELLILKPEDIDHTGPVWIYVPHSHKTAYRGKPRQIYFGPKCQTILTPLLLGAKTDDYLFSPRRAEGERNDERSANRRTPRYRSHMQRNKSKRKKHRRRPPAEVYSKESYHQAVARACEKAYPLPDQLAKLRGESNQAWKTRLGEKGQAEVKAWREKHSFSPHQLRHLAATKIRKEYGIELSRILLGHSDIGTTQIYAEVDAQKAMDAASKIG